MMLTYSHWHKPHNIAEAGLLIVFIHSLVEVKRVLVLISLSYEFKSV